MARYVFLDEARLNSPQPAEVSLPPLQSRLRGWWPWLPTSSDPNPRGDRRWMPDEKCTKCFACGEFFNTWTRRRHHCRLCGQIFCHKCCSNWVKGALVGRPNETRSRLCEACTDFVDDKLIDRSNIGRSALSGETDARNAVPAQDFYGQDQSPTGEDDARSARSNSSSDSSGEDEEEAEDPEVNDYRAEVGLPKESLEHLNEALEGLKDLECRASYDKHGAEWWRRAEAGARRFAGSVKAYCQEVGLDQEHVQVICKLAQQVVERTKLEQDDSMDILEYVKVKKVPVGNIKDSKCLDGVVFSADVVHRKMPSDIDNCPLMLIQMPLTFDKYNVRTDLDALRDQEQIYLDLKVEKIVKDVLPESPKLLLCQAVVSQLAQEKLCKRGISVIIGVPEHILRAIARCTGSKVVPAVDSIRRTFPPSPECNIGGKATRFYVDRVGYAGEEGYKALAVIESSIKGKFSTLLLRGPETQACIAKKVLRWAIRLARHLQLESELLFELWCAPNGTDPKECHFEKHGEAGDDFESREMVAYIINNNTLICDPPLLLHFSAYGALDDLSVRDCTVREWLESCFRERLPEPEGAAAAAPADPPLPEPGKVLCFQRRLSRLVVQLIRDEEGQREAGTAAKTRWSLLNLKEEERSEAESGRLTLELWRFCGECRRQVTPRSALSNSAGWHSMAKFLEILLHNTSSCSALASEADACPHALRDHILFCCCQERPGLVVGFKWEQVPLWKLRPPHMPLWDPETWLLDSTQTSQAANLAEVFRNAYALQEKTAEFMRSVLLCLSTLEPEDQLSPRLPAPKSESSLRALQAAEEEAEKEHKEISITKEIRDPKEAENIELVNMRQWLCEHKTAWHRAIVNLNEFHAEISKRLKKVKDCLGSEDREVMEKADQLLANTLCREILDAFREGASKSSRAKDIYEDLVNLQKLRTVGDKSKNAAVPLQQMMSSLITTATETYNRFWTPERGGGEAELKPRADSGEPLSGAGSWISTLDMTPEEVAKRENELRPQVRGALPIHLDSVIKAFGRAVEESEQTTSEFEKCAHGICLPVSFDDVGSQIAYALISDKARDQMEGQLGCCLDADSDACLRSLPTALRRPSVKVSRDERKPPQEENETLSKLKNIAWKMADGGTRYEWEQEWENLGLRDTLTAPIREPVKVDFEGKQFKFSVTIFMAPQFHALRHWICGDDLNFVRSLHKCRPASLKGGKTKALFHISHDERLVLKSLQGKELEHVKQEAASMFWYFDKVLFDKWPSVLTQVLGLFTVTATNKRGQTNTGWYIVQQNIRFSLRSTPHHVFDLKGVGIGRRVPTAVEEEDASPAGAAASTSVAASAAVASAGEGPATAAAAAAAAAGYPGPLDGPSPTRAGPDPVFWDQNFREWTKGKPLCLVPSDQWYLEAAMFNDTRFLSALNLMDYSLLLAAVKEPDQDQKGRLCLGIIDYLRPYTLDKLFEGEVKKRFRKDATVCEPSQYAARFTRAMSSSFVAQSPENEDP